ncbi:MAG: tetratricopeptide repeat protein [Saprospiraceae bacterium]|jgi:tetratricopeptide (TPR) repeat protein
MNYKVIVSGHLEFGNSRSYEKMFQSYKQRLETYYKQDVFFKLDENVVDGQTALDIPRFIGQTNEKTWRNTVGMFESIAQFAVAGNIHIWKLQERTLVAQILLEPNCDKSAVQSFLRGRELISEGKEGEAKEVLSQAIEKFERHALAYERRGHVNFVLNNLGDAHYDFSKSIGINPHNPEAYVGRALVLMTQNRFQPALEDLELAIKSSIPHQPVYWKARRLKGEAHLEREEYQMAEAELRFFLNRSFQPGDPNYGWRRKAFFNYGRALLQTGKCNEALDAFDQAILIETAKDTISSSERLFYRSQAQQALDTHQAAPKKDARAVKQSA